jgi:hypothetical protein
LHLVCHKFLGISDLSVRVGDKQFGRTLICGRISFSRPAHEFGFNFVVPPNNMPMNSLLLFINTDTQFIFKFMGFVTKIIQ